MRPAFAISHGPSPRFYAAMVLRACGLGLAAGAWLVTAQVVAADSLVSSENPSNQGDAVTFTASFTVPCADGVSSASFSIDGVAQPVSATGSGKQFSASYTTSSLTPGTHAIEFTWSTETPGMAPCGGNLSLTQTVNSPPPPPPPPQSPSEAASPAETPSPSAAASATTAASAPRAHLAANSQANNPTVPLALALLGAAVAVALGITYQIRARRRHDLR